MKLTHLFKKTPLSWLQVTREKILHVFQNLPKGNHLSAEELQELLDKRGEGISLSTIYRSVKLMSRMGILRELELAEGHKHYELNQPYPHHHHHLVCIQCNKTIEFNNDSILKHSLKQCEKEGFQLIDCQLTVMAICPEALRMGWPSGIPSNWGCTRSLVDTRFQNCEIPESKEPEPEN